MFFKKNLLFRAVIVPSFYNGMAPCQGNCVSAYVSALHKVVFTLVRLSIITTISLFRPICFTFILIRLNRLNDETHVARMLPVI